jgi:hypothetical protein
VIKKWVTSITIREQFQLIFQKDNDLGVSSFFQEQIHLQILRGSHFEKITCCR